MINITNVKASELPKLAVYNKRGELIATSFRRYKRRIEFYDFRAGRNVAINEQLFNEYYIAKTLSGGKAGRC